MINRLNQLPDYILVVLAHKELFVLAGDVVPDDAVAVEVVQHGQASLVVLALEECPYFPSGNPCLVRTLF